MIGRMGNVEMQTILTYLAITKNAHPLAKLAAYILGEINAPWWDAQIKLTMSNNAGFFPTDDHALSLFAEKILRDVSEVDILGSWLEEETQLLKFMPRTKFVPLPALEPYYHPDLWSQSLAGKRVLVIHPFAESINRQYQNHRLLFKDPRVLPDFDLVTLKAVQSIAGTQVAFASWFDALREMCEKINEIDFDIAIIGAGAYSFPLAAYVKRIGKKSVHLGGATQILFGIKGKRWDSWPFFQQLYNEHWVRPSPAETPENFQFIETGCYW